MVDRERGRSKIDLLRIDAQAEPLYRYHDAMMV